MASAISVFEDLIKAYSKSQVSEPLRAGSEPQIGMHSKDALRVMKWEIAWDLEDSLFFLNVFVFYFYFWKGN